MPEAPEVKEDEGARGGVLMYAAQGVPKSDAEIRWIGHPRSGNQEMPETLSMSASSESVRNGLGRSPWILCSAS